MLAAVLCVCIGSIDFARGSLTTTQTKVYGGAQIQEIYRLSLEPDDLILESITQAIKEHNIQDGAVLTTVGATKECAYHYVKDSVKDEDVFVNQKGAAEITVAKFSGPPLKRAANKNGIVILGPK